MYIKFCLYHIILFLNRENEKKGEWQYNNRIIMFDEMMN